MKFLVDLWEALKYFLFPPRCPVCHKICDESYQLCAACSEKILQVKSYDRDFTPIDKVLRVTKYRDGSRDMLRKLKFDNDLSVLPALKKILDDVSDREEILSLLSNVDLAVPVPIHIERQQERGFNQTVEIFGDWLAKKNLPLQNILSRTRSTPKLYEHNKSEREEILHGVFAPADDINLSGKSVLIVDDIFTTGTTCKECAKVIKSLGAKKIYVLAFAASFGENFTAIRN